MTLFKHTEPPKKEYWLILDKYNKVVGETTSEEEAKKYVAARPYLKYQKL